MENYYELIGVSQKADINIIKQQYLNKLKKYHPDLYDGDKIFAEEMTAKLNLAYNTLKNEELRKEYNLSLTNHLKEERQKQKHIKNRNRKKTNTNKFRLFFKNIGENIKDFFKTFKKQDKSNSELTERELKALKDKKRLNIIILIETILVIILFILVLVT